VLLARGDWDEAFADYDQAVRLSPEKDAAYVARGLAHEGMGQVYEALADYEAALRVLPEGARKDSVAATHEVEVLGRTVLTLAAVPPATGDEGRSAYERGDYAAAAHAWLPLAEQGDITAAIALGNLYWTGKGAAPDKPGSDAAPAYGEAAKWYRKAADAHVADAELKLAEMYWRGLGVEQDFGEAVQRFGRASDLGNKDALRRLDAMDKSAAALAAAGDHAAAARIWRPLAERGNTKVEFSLARSLLLAADAREDPAETYGWLQKSAGRGDAKARFLIATFYGAGSNPQRGDAQASAWLRGTADQLKNGVAAYGRGDFGNALKLLTPLATFGDASAQGKLGEIYEKGNGVPRDFAETLKWYRLASEQGDLTAKRRLPVVERFESGMVRYHLGDWPGAVSEFDEAIGLDGYFPDAYDARGWVYSAAANRDMAVVSFAKARDLRLAQGWVENPSPWDGEMQLVTVRSDVACEPDCPEWISAEGRITAATVGQFKRAIKAMGDKRLPIIIQSPGGDVQAALAIGRLIRAKKLDVAIGRTAFEGCLPGQKNCPPRKGTYRGSVYSTYAVCASACPLILAAGEERLVGRLAAAAVHQVKTVHSKTLVTYEVKYQMVNGRKVILSKKTVARKNLTNETVKLTKSQEQTLEAYFKEMGVDTALIPIMTATPYETVHKLSAQELDGLHVVTKPAEGEILVDPRLCAGSTDDGHGCRDTLAGR
jgi:TPR repeat protein